MSKFKITIILIIYLVICHSIYQSTTTTTISKQLIPKISTPTIITVQEEEPPIGTLKIPKINLNQKIYSITSTKNNIEEHVTVLEGSIEPSQKNSIIFLAAHSGTSNISFFNQLDTLEINDEIYLTYKNINYIYYIKDIWETSKDGNIEVIKESKNQLVLTTCSQKNQSKQLIINCIKKDA